MLASIAPPKIFAPISKHPANPRYLLDRGRLTTLITSAESYGGDKFDLDTWNPEFTRRLKDSIRYAESKKARP